MSEDRRESPTEQDQIEKLVEMLSVSVANGVTRGLDQSLDVGKIVNLIEGLEKKVDGLQQEVERLRAARVQAAPVLKTPFVPSVPLASISNRPPISSRPRNRNPVRPTVSYRIDPRKTSSDDSNCTEPGCDRPARSRGLCSMHYQRLRSKERKITDKQTSSDPLPPPPGSRNQAIVEKGRTGTRGVFSILYDEKGHKLLSGFINQIKLDRGDLILRLNENFKGLPGVPLEEEDVLRSVHYHDLGEALRKREGEILCRHLTKQRGSLVKTSQKMKLTIDKLRRRIEELGLQEESTRIRNEFKDEVLEQATFNERLNLALTREKYLEDLGIEKEVDELLLTEISEQFSRLQDGDEQEKQEQICRLLSIDSELYLRMVKRFGLQTNGGNDRPESP
ncbi:MAG TPA: hypothetical protein VM425_05635 [Myxococcota bacterium]|nr:hypothetical protein [Myxococcota bacterium]